MFDLSSYEWHYFIGGDCKLKHRKSQAPPLAFIRHEPQGVYEAVLVRHTDWYGNITDYFSLGMFDSPDEAQRIIHQALTNLQEDACITT